MPVGGYTRTSGAVTLAVVVRSGDTVEVRVLAPLDADTGRKLAVWRPPGSGNTWEDEVLKLSAHCTLVIGLYCHPWVHYFQEKIWCFTG